MAQEIYHRSEWGNPNEQWGNVYLNADLTNELYKRASEYENSWVTDQLLNGVGTKPSIILTPTAYEDGLLNSVKPAKTFGSELVTNGDFSNGSTGWNLGAGWSIINEQAVNDGTINSIYLNSNIIEGATYECTLDITFQSAGVAYWRLGNTTNIGIMDNGNDNGTVTQILTGSANGTYIGIFTNTAITIDNVSVKEVIDADFDFTRGSSATRVNELGLVQDVQLLSGELIQNGNFEQIGNEEIVNGGFDSDTDWTKGTGWSISGGKAISDGTSGSHNLTQGGAVTAGKTYKITITVSDYVSGNVEVSAGAAPRGTMNANGTYTFYQYATPANSFYIIANSFEGSIDNVSVKEVGQNWDFGIAWGIENGKALYDGSSNGSLIQQYNILTSGKKYKASFNVLDNSGRFRISVDGGASTYQTYTTGNGYYTFEFTSASTNFRIGGSMGDSADTFSIDNVSVIEITDDTDLPRINYTNFDYENGEVVPYSGEGSLLLENQSTNLITYSEDFSQWAKQSGGTGTNPVITSNNEISPDGTQNADKVVFNKGTGTTTSDLSILSISFTSQSNTASFYIKADTPQRIVVRNSSTWVGYDIGTEWTRIEKTDTGGSLQIGLRDGYGIADVPNIATVYLWGAQVEALSYATSYIPTNGSTVTRLADVCNNSGSSDLINSTEGVLYAEISALTDTDTTNPNRGISISSGSTNNTVFIYYQSALNRLACILISNGSTQFSHSTPLFDVDDYLKIALKYKQNDFALWVNGTEIATDTSGNAPIGLNELAFDNGVGNDPFYGNVKCVAVFKEALSDTELQKLTTI